MKGTQFHKGKHNKKNKKIRELTGNHENLTAVKDLLSELHEVSQDFRVVHKAYHSKIESGENDLRESDEYCLSVGQSARELEQQIDSWLRDVQHDLERSIRTQRLSENNNIQPEDSISNVGSRVSSRASSSRSSLRSTTSSCAKVAARKAALEVQAATLGRLHELEIELKLQQRKKELHLRGEIAAAEAEREVNEQVEAEELSGFQCHSPSAKTTPAVQSNIISMNELTKHDKPNWTTEGYREARKLLKKRFGQNYQVAAAHVERVIEGPPIKHEDAHAREAIMNALTNANAVLAVNLAKIG